MLDSTDLLNIIKKAAIDAVNVSQPSDFCFGKVVSANPLKISVEQKLTLTSAQLILTRNVTDFKTKISVNLESENGGSDEHSHMISGTHEITIHNGLKIGDEVILMKKKGGQKYLVLDKAVKS